MSAAWEDAGPEEVGTVGEEAAKLLGAVSEAISDWEADPANAPGPDAAPSWSDGLAALAGDAAEALRAVRDAPADDGDGRAGGGDRGGAHGAEHGTGTTAGAGACRWCPLCRAAHLLEETHPEVRVHLLSAARSLLRATALVLEQVQREPPDDPARPAPAPPDPRERRGSRAGGAPGVEHIDLDDDGPPGPGTTTGPRGHDEEYW